ncbi:hypothetical protein [Burkholderia pseudomallei]|uniref:hypothetical protein n=1 Tax=Burkholderia pseudomallei TaxID=28450 RepID=UPI0011C4BE76|nr:hypothetical protein [Burkholderia pseudomallei]
MVDRRAPENTELHTKFVGIWRRALALSSLNDLNAETVAAWAQQAGVNVLEVVERDVGIFRPTPAVVLTTAGGVAYFPKISPTDDQAWLANRRACERVAALWEKVEWFAPLWVPQGRINELLKDVESRSKEDAISCFDYHTSTIYVLSFQAVCIAQLIPRSRSLAGFAPIAREAYLAFYAGYRASSIAALMPVVEGALRRIAEDSGKLPVPDQIDRIIDRACLLASRLHFDGNWVPREYRTSEFLYGQDERIFVFETFRQWLKSTFFRQTGEYDGITWLNRHLFAHGTSTDWQNSANFCRLVVALATLGVIESWHDESNAVPVLFPEMNDDSRLLWQQAQLQAQAQMMIKLVEQKNYQEHGQLVPPMPTDDGVTLRKTRLTQECMNDLVRPLRDAGWSIDVGEPDSQALHMKVVARSEGAVLRVALLYGCATDNKLYRELEQESDVILYLGPPYQQSAYAYGINVHVGPVAAWQPPPARNRERTSFVINVGGKLMRALRRFRSV